MPFIIDNIAVLFIASVVCGLGWLFGGRDQVLLLKVIPWLTVFMVEVALCFPQRHSGESTAHARSRAWSAMKKDPLVWTTLGFLALLLIPFLNTGLCPDCDKVLIDQGHSPAPPFSLLPFCVDRIRHLNVVMWFAPSLLAMLAARHALVERGKRTLIEAIVWNGAAMALLGFVQQVTDAPGPLWRPFPNGVRVYFFSTFGYPNMAGCYFATVFCLSVAAWRRRADDVHQDIEKTNAGRRFARHRLFWMKHFMMIPSILCLFATMDTLSRAAIILVASAAAILFVHAAVTTLAKMKKADRVRALAFCGLALIVLAIIASGFMPDSVQKEMHTVDTREALDRVTGRGEYHSKVAMEIWREHAAFGVGGWGYIHFSPLKLPPRKYWAPGSANVHNDHLQFLVEHGFVGYLLLVAIVAMLLGPTCSTWIRLSKATRFLPANRRPPPPQALFALPAPAFAVLVAAAIPVIHAFGDCPFRSAAVMSLFFTMLACIDGYLPRDAASDDQPSDVESRHRRHHHHHHSN